jgi:hypothetical protein
MSDTDKSQSTIEFLQSLNVYIGEADEQLQRAEKLLDRLGYCRAQDGSYKNKS